MITFGDHLGSLTASDSAEDQSHQARQVLFFSVLIHEATHLRDYRARHMPAKMDAMACITTEQSGYVKEFEFKRAMASAKMDDNHSSALYRRAAERQLIGDEQQFSNNFWKLYCILAHPNIMDD
jgi:hypothetical protein